MSYEQLVTSERKRRLIIATALFAIYWGVQLGDWVIGHYVLSSPHFTQGAAKVTLRHFQQPEEHPFTPTYWDTFLERVTRNKPGIMASKSFYVILLGVYVGLTIWLFFELTSDRVWNKTNNDS